MKSKVFLIVTFTLSILIFFNTCGQQKTEWQGTIEEVDGVIIVKNPQEPIYGEDILNVEEDLTIGENSDKKEPTFLNIRSLRVDNEKRIYVLDSKACKVKVFDNKGNHLFSFSKKG